MLVHVPAHSWFGGTQVEMHAPPLHVCPLVHTLPHVPQLALSVFVLVQMPAQSWLGGVHVTPPLQTPAMHVWPPVQMLLQVPQLLLSVCRLTHVLLQSE